MTQVLKELAANGTYTWNGAVSNATTGFEKLGTVLDYFSKAGTYTGREQKVVDADMGRIFADDEQTALKVLFGLRLITRKPTVNGIEETQTGFGRKDEFYKAVTWLHNHRPELLYRNLMLIPVFGCWKDLITEPLIDVLDRQKVYELVAQNLNDNLLRKYLPQIRSKARSQRDGKRTAWGKGLCQFLKINNVQYRKLKTEGAAHVWQRQMSAREWDKINFNGIPGKAMLQHTSLKGRDKQTVFERHNLVPRLIEWVNSQKNVKFNGYPYELTQAAAKNPSLVQKLIYNKQFESLLDPMRGHNLGNVLACLDTSGSMRATVTGKTTAYDICVSMGLVFSALNVGYFQDAVVAFDNVSTLVKLKGEFCDRFQHIKDMTTAWGSTNFQSVIDLLVGIRKKNPNIPTNEYPETLLVCSDMQFNAVGGNTQTNYEAAMKKLAEVGLERIRIIWWFVNGAGKDFPSRMDDKGVYIIGGFDPTNIKALMGLDSTKKDFIAEEKAEETPLDGMKNFLSQPIFSLIQ